MSMALYLLLCVLDFNDGTAAIVAALGAGAMRKLLLVANRALREASCSQKIMGAAIGSPARGVASLWIRHVRIPFLGDPAANTGLLILQ